MRNAHWLSKLGFLWNLSHEFDGGDIIDPKGGREDEEVGKSF